MVCGNAGVLTVHKREIWRVTDHKLRAETMPANTRRYFSDTVARGLERALNVGLGEPADLYVVRRRRYRQETRTPGTRR